MANRVECRGVIDEINRQCLALAQDVLAQRPQDGGVVPTSPGFVEDRLSVLEKSITLSGHSNQHDTRENFKYVI